ncbi:MAG: hypothetical protein PHE88_11710 [Elusimicrobia bacterium]|nr:hypothetical protein [Elusimicrobiota bacterium]
MTDYAAIAKQFGGASQPPQASQSGVDYSSLAKQFGGETIPPQSQSWGDVATGALTSFVPSVGKMVGDVASTVIHPIDTATGLAKTIVGAGEAGTEKLAGMVNPELVAFNRQINKPSEEQQMAGQMGDYYKQKYGSMEGFKKALATDPAGVMADAATVLSGGGAAVSKLPLLEKAGIQLSKAGAAVDPLAMTAKAITAPVGYVSDKLSFFKNPEQAAVEKLAEQAGGKEELAKAIDTALSEGETVSGTPYTLGQAGKNAGIAATERARSAVAPEVYQQTYETQRTGRVNALNDLAKDEETLRAAIEARDESAKAMYEPAFQSDLQRQQAEQMAANARRNLQTGGIGGVGQAEISLSPKLEKLKTNPVIQSAKRDATNLAATYGEDIGDPMQSLKGLHYMKLAIDSQLNRPVANTALGSHSAAALSSTKRALMDAIVGTENKPGISPAYGNAVKQYAEMSKPINQMQVGQKLLSTLVGEATKYGANPAQAKAAFFRALENAPAMIKRETGMSKQLEDVLTPEQMTNVNRVARELAKEVDLQNLGKGAGSDTVQKAARNNMLSGISSMVTNNRLSRTGQAVSFLTRLIKEGKDIRSNAYMDAMIQNPKLAKQALENVNIKNPGRISTLAQKGIDATAIVPGANRFAELIKQNPRLAANLAYQAQPKR